METRSKRHSIFKALAVLGQLAALFPFAVFFEAMALEKLVVWHFFAIYAVWIVFRESGYLIEKLLCSLRYRRIHKRLVPITYFLSRIGFAVPTAAFIALSVWLKSEASAYFYILPACIIIYFGGNLSVGRSYSDIFSRSWFALNVVASVLSVIALSISEETDVSETARYILCVGFAVVTLLSAVLANQTNIDTVTNQRDAGKAALPEGLRRYNTLLVMGIVTLTLGMFVFAKPLASLLRTVIGAVVGAVLFLYAKLYSLFLGTDEEAPINGSEANPPLIEPQSGGQIGNIVFAVILIAIAVLMIVFRKAIFNAIKSFIEPLFRIRAKPLDRPFADEITSSDAKLTSPRAQKKAERELLRRYKRETSPERKFRLGYALFLARLRRTSQPPVPSDTTDAHREKGEKAFGEDLRVFSEAYNKVRYADLPPTAEELSAADELLRRIK